MRLTGLPPTGRIPRLRSGPPPRAAGLTEIADFGANPGALRMFVHMPARLPKTAPLVVILHGCGQTAAGYRVRARAGMKRPTGWVFALLAPEQQDMPKQYRRLL